MAQKPKLKRDWIGRYVRLLYRLETKGGSIFEEGEVMEVEAYYRGLSLQALRTCPHCYRQNRLRICRVQEECVSLLPLDYRPPEGDPPVEHLKEES